MDTRRLRRWLSSHDPVDVVLIVGSSSADHGSAEERTEGAWRFGRRRSSTPKAVAVVVPDDADLKAADLLQLLTCARRVDVVLPLDPSAEAAQALSSEVNEAHSVATTSDEAGADAGGVADVPSGPRAEVEGCVGYAAELAAMCGRAGDIGVVKPQVAVGVPHIDPDHVPVGRRALIGAPDRPLPEPAATPQRRLVDAVSALLATNGLTAADVESAELLAAPTGSARLQAKGCCGDGLCARVCPNDALRLEVVELEAAARPGPPGVGAPPRAQSQFRLVQVAADCDGCGACIEMCPNDALARVGDHSWSDLLKRPEATLRAGWVRGCSRCGAAHRQVGDLCAVCKAQQENPFAVRLPPGLTL